MNALVRKAMEHVNNWMFSNFGSGYEDLETVDISSVDIVYTEVTDGLPVQLVFDFDLLEFRWYLPCLRQGDWRFADDLKKGIIIKTYNFKSLEGMVETILVTEDFDYIAVNIKSDDIEKQMETIVELFEESGEYNLLYAERYRICNECYLELKVKELEDEVEYLKAELDCR